VDQCGDGGARHGDEIVHSANANPRRCSAALGAGKTDY
jgi:hypothetical protein